MYNIREKEWIEMNLEIKKIVEICNGQLICGKDNVVVKHFSKDTRTIKEDDCYIGIKGENFNGNQYIGIAFEKGACACIVDEMPNEKYDKPVILVENSILALQSIATYVRKQKNIPIVAITGSAGKTSTKDMIGSVLNQKYKVYKTPGNLNGQIGLPLSLLEADDVDIIVLEMGMNGFGMIHNLTKIAEPDLAVITNIGTAHIGLLGSRENILKAKLEILDGMKKSAPLAINNDNDLLQNLQIPNPLIKCGLSLNSDYRAENIKVLKGKTNFDISGETISLPLMGDVFVSNALLAIAVGTYFDVPFSLIKKGLETVSISGNRMKIETLKNGATLIDDTYNSNLEALKEALNTLKEYPGKRKIAVIGDMLELEEFSEKIHRDVGNLPVLNSFDFICLYGDKVKFTLEEIKDNIQLKEKVYYFDTLKSLQEFLEKTIQKEDVILLKASNGMHLKEIVENLKRYSF